MQSQELNRFTAAEVPGIKAYPNVTADTMAGAAGGVAVLTVLTAGATG